MTSVRKLLHWPLVAAVLGLVAGAHAGTNEGFTVEVPDPVRLVDPDVGQTVRLAVVAQNTQSVDGTKAVIAYDTLYVTYTGYEPGDITPGAIPLATPPADYAKQGRSDGLVEISGGGTYLPRNPRSTAGGTIGTFTFQVAAEIPEGGVHISVISAEVNVTSSDKDVLTFEPGQLGVSLVRSFPNQIFDIKVERKLNGAAITWNSRFPGFDDVARVRAVGTTEHSTFESPLRDRFDAQDFEALQALVDAGIDLRTVTNNQIEDVLKDHFGLPLGVPSSLIRKVRELDFVLRSRSHVVLVHGLDSATPYEFYVVSAALNGKRSRRVPGRFTTRAAPDIRALFQNNVDVQTTQTAAAISFGTNRPAITSYVVRKIEDGTTIADETINEDGATATRIVLEGLEPRAAYEIALTLTLVGAQDLIAAGMPENATTRLLTRAFRTRLLQRPVRMLRPPAKIVGSDRAQIVFGANQPVGAIIDYGVIAEPSQKITQEMAATDEELYQWQSESVATLPLHSMSLANLDPSTTYRYKITLVNAEGDTFTTDPRGNDQWSRDLRLTTSAAADTLPPALILGPVVDIRNVLAVVRFVTDVPTAATLFIGTEGGTYDTEDEFEFSDLSASGERRFANRHSIIVQGLEPGVAYRYRLEIEAANGKTTVFEPGQQASGKIAGVLQPPGGAGSFTTSNDPDTQFPVILSGPTVTSKTHDTAIVEWTTDEPAYSDVRFGVEALDEGGETSGTSKTTHKMTLSNLVAGTTYSYLVASTDASGNGATESATAVFTTNPELDLTAPAITADPEVVYKNDETAAIQWTTDEEATSEISFGTDESLGFIRTLPTTDKVHEITLTNLEPSTTYYVQASSIDLSNNGPTQSAVLHFTTDAQADQTAPLISGIQVAEADSSAIIAWTTDELADSYIDFGTVQGLLDLTVGAVEDVEEHEITLTNLTPGTTYYYTVGSIDRASNSFESEPRQFTTLSSADLQAPATPTGLTSTVGSGQVVLSWTASTELDLAGYSVYRRLSGADSFTAIATRLTGTTYTDAGLTNETIYEYQMAAVDRADNVSAFTDVLSLTPTASAAPSAPVELTTSGDNFLRPTLVFGNATPFNTGAALAYTVQVSTEADFSNVTGSESGIAEGSGQTSWTLSRDLTEGETYYWRVRAVEGSLTGPFSATQEYIAQAAPELPGDFDGNNVVDFDDFFAFVDVFGQPAADHPQFDLNGAGDIIDFDDFFAFVDAFGTSATGKVWARAVRLDECASLSLEAVGGQRPDDGLITVRVWAEELAEVRSFGLVIGYDPHAVTFESAQEGPGHLLESQGGSSPLFGVLHHRPGELLIGNGLVEAEAVSGHGLLAELTFRSAGFGALNRAFFDLREAYVASSADRVRRVARLQSAQVQPRAYALGANFPNPFNPTTTIEYALPVRAPAALAIYDVLGRRIRTLVRRNDHPAGFYAITWDGRDQQGRPVGNGLYFYRLVAPAFERTGKMMLIK